MAIKTAARLRVDVVPGGRIAPALEKGLRCRGDTLCLEFPQVLMETPNIASSASFFPNYS